MPNIMKCPFCGWPLTLVSIATKGPYGVEVYSCQFCGKVARDTHPKHLTEWTREKTTNRDKRMKILRRQ